jgi:uncharacterized Zn finger protein (UPF0148 family)
MSIQITKQGREDRRIQEWKVDVVCSLCDCEFNCLNTDFVGGKITCPNCGNTIYYQQTETYKNTEQHSSIIAKRIERLKEEVLETIDLEKINRYMKWSNWTWASAKNGVPDVEEIRAMLLNLIEDAVTKKSTISTGGFCVTYIEHEEDEDEPASVGVDVTFYCEHTRADINAYNFEPIYY